ncbi:hypothetical protein [Corynebacterium cystitidis]|uniref:hypothetical protein n=1 Tax=Corynebacterium cystitidis TaxID=35757 RepID=UPI00211E89F1|nr:hypothetical protein [Corynebacterium cystitidis]
MGRFVEWAEAIVDKQQWESLRDAAAELLAWDRLLAVERAVQTVYSLILGYFDQQQFYSLDELNEAIAEHVDEFNDVRQRSDGLTRRELFPANERPVMCPLPDEPGALSPGEAGSQRSNSRLLLLVVVPAIGS